MAILCGAAKNSLHGTAMDECFLLYEFDGLENIK
jgi:hypothetical protein